MCRSAKADCVIINLSLGSSNGGFSGYISAYKGLMTTGLAYILVGYSIDISNEDLNCESVHNTKCTL